jgi:death on curing protein
MTRYVSVEQVIRINARVQQGEALVHDRNMLESAVARPMTSAFGEDAYPTIIDKAAALLHSLVLNHPFVDGNKRTATLATIAFLYLNNIRVKWDEKQALEFIVETAEGKHNVSVIAQWLTENTETLEK